MNPIYSHCISPPSVQSFETLLSSQQAMDNIQSAGKQIGLVVLIGFVVAQVFNWVNQPVEEAELPEQQFQASEEEQWAAFSNLAAMLSSENFHGNDAARIMIKQRITALLNKFQERELLANIRHWDRIKLQRQEDSEMLFRLMDYAKGKFAERVREQESNLNRRMLSAIELKNSFKRHFNK